MKGKRSGKSAKRSRTKAIVSQPVRELVGATALPIPAGYPALLEDIKSRIRSAQIKAALSVNRELVELYWSIGRDIVLRQHSEGWGKSVVERLAADLKIEFPGVVGFSAASIWRMRSFYLAWSEPVLTRPAPKSGAKAKLSQPVRDLSERHSESILAQPVRELGHCPAPLANIPWGHNIILLQKLQSRDERLWYAEQTTINGWSRSMLVHWIESDLHSRQGKTVNNFHRTLPPPQSDLARELLKDPYNFDFLTLAADAAERELEKGLLDHIRQFLIELGTGFAFVGQQVPLEVDGEDFFLDLLFYHLRLRCFIVIDLKAGDFKPEHGGKMNFYLSAVDDRMKHADDEPSIGLILCKTAKKMIAEYALRDLAKPVGVARYVTKLVEKLPKELAEALPSIEQIEAALANGGNDGK